MSTTPTEQLGEEAFITICEVFHVTANEISDIRILKKGMTNRSFLFKCKGKRYIMRISGVGTEKLIDRHKECNVYETIKDYAICDPIIYMNPEKGYKITEFLENSRVCNPMNDSDMYKSMQFLRNFHQKRLTVKHEFDIFNQIQTYQILWETSESIYTDYENTKKNVYSLKPYIDSHTTEKVLTHIDAVSDNFLFVKNETSEEDIRLIDWEYAGMQDPHIDIAMFCIYSSYNPTQIEKTIDAYFSGVCPKETRIKIHCYIATCGLLWSNWCEYKERLGISFGAYALKQYQYAKEYSQIALLEINEMEKSTICTK